ncbi:MAG: LCP family protein [Rhodococcus sp. (in: high G+C Gram-positive bacteria)]
MAVALFSAGVLLVTGVAWQSIDSLRSNLATVSNLDLGNGADGAVDILLVGTDSRTDAHGNALSQSELDSLRAGDEVANNTDTIILIRVPNDGSSASAISIPRDSYVAVPGIGDSKINAAYGATKEENRLELVQSGVPDAEADRESTLAGRKALIDSVSGLTGVTVDHYAEVGLLGFVLLTDAVGGVDVCLNAPVNEPLSGANFPAGPQTLSGADALSFVRQRHDLPRGDLDRIVRQQVFMASLVRKVLSARTLSNPGTLGQLGSAVQRSVVIDDDWDVLDFATKLQDVAGGAVTFDTIPVADINGVTDYGESIVAVDPVAVRTWVASLLDSSSKDGASTDDQPSDSDAPTSSAPDIDTSGVTVDVANDSGIDGLASSVSETLGSEGFARGEVGNYVGTSVAETTVFAGPSDGDAANAVAASVGAQNTETDDSLPSGTVRVVLASDYSAPTDSGLSTDPELSTDSESTLAGVTSAGDVATPAPAAENPIDAGSTGPTCVN